MSTTTSPDATAASPLDDLFAYIDASPSPFHAVEEAAVRLSAAGFVERDESDDFGDTAGRNFAKRDGAIIAWIRDASAPAHAPLRMVGAHTDSPNLRIKPKPEITKAGYRQLGVEVYGGALLNSWLDRDLGISGRVIVDAGGRLESRLVTIDRPVLRVTQLAIHLDREVNEGLALDRQTQLTPIWAQASKGDETLASFIGGETGIDPDSIRAFDLMTHDLTPSSRLGAHGEFYAAPRIDNLASCAAAVRAMTSASHDTGQVSVLCLFDHEEIGSTSHTGASGAFLPDIVERIVIGAGGDRQDLLRAIARSWCVSADGAHAVHPNYLDRYEPDHHVVLNGGPAVKVNANVRYATDATGLAMFSRVCEEAGVPVQSYVHRTNLACGSTIGPLTAANLGMRTVDVGSSQLSMHSAREMGGADDPGHLAAALTTFFELTD